MAGQNNDFGRVLAFAQAFQQRHAVQTRHVDVGQDDLKSLLPDKGQSLYAVSRNLRRVAEPLQFFLQNQAQVSLVFDD